MGNLKEENIFPSYLNGFLQLRPDLIIENSDFKYFLEPFNDFHPLTIFPKSFVLYVRQGSKYASANVDQRSQKLKYDLPLALPDFLVSGKMKMVVRFSVYLLIFNRVSIVTLVLLLFFHTKKQITTKDMCRNVLTSEKG